MNISFGALTVASQVYSFTLSGGAWRFHVESDQNLGEMDSAITAIEIEDRTDIDGRDIAWIGTSKGPIIRLELANPEKGLEQGLMKRVGVSLFGFHEIKVE